MGFDNVVAMIMLVSALSSFHHSLSSFWVHIPLPKSLPGLIHHSLTNRAFTPFPSPVKAQIKGALQGGGLALWPAHEASSTQVFLWAGGRSLCSTDLHLHLGGVFLR